MRFEIPRRKRIWSDGVLRAAICELHLAYEWQAEWQVLDLSRVATNSNRPLPGRGAPQ